MEKLKKNVKPGQRVRLQLSPSSKLSWNKGVSASARGRGTVPTSAPMSDTHYWNASLRQAYGKPQLAGWLDDAVGALVPGMKVNVDYGKLITSATSLLSPKTAQKYATTVNRFGLSANYQGVDITPNRFATAWKYAGLAGVIAEVPMWAWIAGAGGVGLVAYGMMKR